MPPDESPVPATSAEVPKAVPAPLPWPARLYHGLAFFLSAILSPYVVIPVGTVGIVYARSSPAQTLLWTSISVFFSTFVPVFYVVFQVWRGKITDVHVMEREQRGGPFLVAIFSSLFAALVLWKLRAPVSVWGLTLILALNGIVLYAITWVYKISMHVSVLSATVLAAVTLHTGLNPWALLWLIPALVWARSARHRHTVWQGLAGCLVACLITGSTLYALGLGKRITEAITRATVSAQQRF